MYKTSKKWKRFAELIELNQTIACIGCNRYNQIEIYTARRNPWLSSKDATYTITELNHDEITDIDEFVKFVKQYSTSFIDPNPTCETCKWFEDYEYFDVCMNKKVVNKHIQTNEEGDVRVRPNFYCNFYEESEE